MIIKVCHKFFSVQALIIHHRKEVWEVTNQLIKQVIKYSIIHQKVITSAKTINHPSAKTKDLCLDKMKHYGVAIPAWANQASPPLMPYYNQELEVTWPVWWVFFGSGFHNTQWCIIWIEKNISEFMCSSLALSGQLRFRSWIRSELRRHHHPHGGSHQHEQHMKPWSNVHQHELGECLTSLSISSMCLV